MTEIFVYTHMYSGACPGPYQICTWDSSKGKAAEVRNATVMYFYDMVLRYRDKFSLTV
jgi:hypothetical protein